MKKLLIICLFILTSCSSQPVLYPNRKYKKVGKDRAKADINICMDEADKFLESRKGKKILKSAGKGAFIGSAVGLISGLFTGDIKGSLTRGAALGGVAGAAGSSISPDQLKQRYVNDCLGKKSYRVLGWD